MQEDGTAPTDAFFATSTGWAVGVVAGGNYSELVPNVLRDRTTFTATVVPTALGTGVNANAFRTPSALTGSFAAGNWTLSATFRSTVAMGTGQTGRVRFRVFKSVNADGTGATELTTTAMVTNTIAGTGNTTANLTPASVLWLPSAQVKPANEYLFIALAWEIVATGGTGNTKNLTFRENTDSGIITTDFTPATPSLLIPTDIRSRSLIRR